MTLDEYFEYYSSHIDENNKKYFEIHKKRLRRMLDIIPFAQNDKQSVIDLGSYGFFLPPLRKIFKYNEVYATVYEPNNPYKIFRRKYNFDDEDYTYIHFNLNLEKECMPVNDEKFDLVLAFELIEHFSCDPNFFWFEINRVMKYGGKIIVTTPNIASLENIFRICWRQIPNPYYFYRKNLSNDRHNLGYGSDLLIKCMENAGFKVINIFTEYFWSNERPEIIEMLKTFGFPTELQGDCLICIGIKVESPKERFPEFLYA